MTQEGILCITDLNALKESGKYFASPGTTRPAALCPCCWYASQTQRWVRVAATGASFMVDFPMSSLQSAHIPWRTIGRARQGERLLSSDSRVLGNQVTLESRRIPWVNLVLAGLREGITCCSRPHPPTGQVGRSIIYAWGRYDQDYDFLKCFPYKNIHWLCKHFHSQHSIMIKTMKTLTQ